MVTLRATQRVLRHLGTPAADPAPSTTALGDWYVNRVHVGRQPLLLMVSELSLLPMLAPARDVRGLPERLPGLVWARLMGLGVDRRLVEAEIAAMESVTVAKTASRSVLGFMNDFAFQLPFHLEEQSRGPATLRDAEARLEDTPCHAGKRWCDCFWPRTLTAELLAARWGC